MFNQIDCLTGYQPETLKSTTNIVAFLLLCLSIIPLGSCNNQRFQFSRGGKTLPAADVSVDELQNQLDDFEELFTSRTKAAAAEIDRLSGDPKIMKMTLLWRSRAIAALHNILEQQQPMVILVDSWLLCTRLTNYIETGEAANIFGDFQPIALEATEEIEAQIENIARKVLSEQLFDQTAKYLQNLALSNPIQSGFSKTLMYSTQAIKDQPGLFESIIRIPLAPVRALEGVDRTSSAIYDFSTATRRMTDVIQELPESARWQLLLSFYDLEETNMAQSFLKSLQSISQSSTKLSAFTEQLPALLEDPNQKQGQIRQTLQQVNETATQLRQLLDTAQQTATVFSRTARDVNLAAVSWANAAHATDEAIRRLKAQTAQNEGRTVAKADLKETAMAVREAANEIKLVSEELPDRTQQMIAQIDSLATRLTIKVAMLIVLVFSLFVAYYFIRKKWATATKYHAIFFL